MPLRDKGSVTFVAVSVGITFKCDDVGNITMSWLLVVTREFMYILSIEGTLAPKRLLVPGFPATLISRCFIGTEKKHIAILTRCV